MSRLPQDTTSARCGHEDEPGGAVDEVRGVLVRSEPYDRRTAQSLVAALIVDIEERYASEGDADDPEAEWAMGIDEVTPPRGVVLVAYVDGQPVGCGALRPLPAAGAGVAEIKRMSPYETSGYHRIPNYGMYAASELSACFAKAIPGA
jgi:hypothetical protein